ncbi:MAG: hypothetical protein WCI18_06865 [Pseudomonadota bacterium]
MTVIPFPDRHPRSQAGNDFSERFMQRIMDVAKASSTDELSLAKSVCSIVEDLVKSTDRLRKKMFVPDEPINGLLDDPYTNQSFARLTAEFPCLFEYPDLDGVTAIALLEEGHVFPNDARLALHFLFHMFGVMNRFNLREARRVWSPEDWEAYVRVCQILPPLC